MSFFRRATLALLIAAALAHTGCGDANSNGSQPGSPTAETAAEWPVGEYRGVLTNEMAEEHRAAYAEADQAIRDELEVYLDSLEEELAGLILVLREDGEFSLAAAAALEDAGEPFELLAGRWSLEGNSLALEVLDAASGTQERIELAADEQSGTLRFQQGIGWRFGAPEFKSVTSGG